VTHVENLSLPLCVLHGANDRRVPVSQARRFREALNAHGFTDGEAGDYGYYELGEESHGSSDIEQKIRAFELLDDFLDHRVGTEASGQRARSD
jgi:dipeptidyl aminopeptidase/acylaminoacyl peptidase